MLSEECKLYKLKDIVKLQNGYAFKSKEFIENEVPIIRINNLQDSKVVIDKKVCYPNEFLQNKRQYEVVMNDILISMSGSVGKISKYSCKTPALLNQRVGKFEILKENNLSIEYLFYFLRSDSFQRAVIKDANGCVVSNISAKSILECGIPMPPLEIQNKIVEVLEKAEKALEKRKESINLLDELVKSQFIEMCANGASDYESWEKVKIEDIAEKKKGSMRTGPFGSALLHSEFVDEGIFVLGIDNAVENQFTWNKMRYITDEKYEQLKNYTVFSGDIIITIMGTVGRSAVIPENFPKAINTKHLACITLNKSIANPYFISYCIHEHPYVMQQLKKQSKGAIMDGLNLTIIKSIKIPLPPIDIQEQFVHFMKQVDKLKFKMEESLKELENNFNSLMQKAFTGELF